MAELQNRITGNGNLEELSLTICSGTDMININYMHIVAKTPEIAKKWQLGLRAITNNNKANNVCPMTCLKKQYVIFLLIIVDIL